MTQFDPKETSGPFLSLFPIHLPIPDQMTGSGFTPLPPEEALTELALRYVEVNHLDRCYNPLSPDFEQSF